MRPELSGPWVLAGHWRTAGSTGPTLNSFLSCALGWGPCFQQLVSTPPPTTVAGFKDMKSQSGSEMMWFLAQLRSRGFSSRICWATPGKAQPHPETLSHRCGRAEATHSGHSRLNSGPVFTGAALAVAPWPSPLLHWVPPPPHGECREDPPGLLQRSNLPLSRTEEEIWGARPASSPRGEAGEELASRAHPRACEERSQQE